MRRDDKGRSVYIKTEEMPTTDTVRLRCPNCNSIIRTRQASYNLTINIETGKRWLNVVITCHSCKSWFDLDTPSEKVRFHKYDEYFNKKIDKFIGQQRTRFRKIRKEVTCDK